MKGNLEKIKLLSYTLEQIYYCKSTILHFKKVLHILLSVSILLSLYWCTYICNICIYIYVNMYYVYMHTYILIYVGIYATGLSIHCDILIKFWFLKLIIDLEYTGYQTEQVKSHSCFFINLRYSCQFILPIVV